MPKRRSDNRDSYSYLCKKLKKLKREIKRGRRTRYESTSSSDGDFPKPYNLQECEPISIDDDCGTYRGDMDPQPGCSYWQQAPTECSDEEFPALVVSDPVAQSPTADNILAPVNVLPPSSVSAALPAAQVLEAPAVESTAVPLEKASEPALPAPQQDVPELDPDLIEILGEDPTSTKEYGIEIQRDLAIRLNHIATSGLSKENRKELKDRYLVPVNCKFIKSPTLNPEIRASLIETQAKRDKGIESKQGLTSCALSSISEAITTLLSSGHKNPELLKLLMDTARILGDMQYTDSILNTQYFIAFHMYNIDGITRLEINMDPVGHSKH